MGGKEVVTVPKLFEIAVCVSLKVVGAMVEAEGVVAKVEAFWK